MDKQRRNALLTGLALAAMAVGLYVAFILQFVKK